jgi:adenylate kinase family enzyme
LGEATRIEVIHLDKLYLKPNWVGTTDENEWRAKLENVLQNDSWIIDGNYSGTLEMRLEACDSVIFLDVPRVVCVWRIFKRFMINRNKTRSCMAEGCNEQLTWEFVKWTWNYPTRSKPKIEKMLKRFRNTKTIFHLKSKKEIEELLQTI